MAVAVVVAVAVAVKCSSSFMSCLFLSDSLTPGQPCRDVVCGVRVNNTAIVHFKWSASEG